ncbi:MAG: 3-dehydroquinate synthase [Candidatus Omnitrophica bacterium]|nr:3-dehydroquinate synthase [Candidatus Omnitrophota bacterium]
MKKLRVKLDKRSYDVLIGQNLLDKIGKLIKSRNTGNDIFIITDTKVASIYLDKVIKSFKNNGFVSIASGIIPEGEENKSWKNYEFLLHQLLDFDKNLDKNIVVICLGGGVVGDIGGFVAGTYRRGVHCIQVPTTLLSQVDSGIGGKTGINLGVVKNLVGMFYQPCLVIIDPLTLQTLDKREFRSGLAEVVKYGIIKDPSILSLLENHVNDLLSLSDMGLIEKIIQSSLNIKSRIVEQDERDEKDIRVVLNFGHTIGHAIESASKYKVYKHGEALSLGIMAAFEISSRLKILKDKNFQGRIENLLRNIGLPLKKNISCKNYAILESMKYDKKFQDGKNKFILPVKPGETKIKIGVDNKIIEDILKIKI